jgi:hypothetical protein
MDGADIVTEEERKEFYYSDGRINPDKAFTYIREAMKTMSREDFLRFATTPVEIVGQSGPTVGQYGRDPGSNGGAAPKG